MVLKCSSKSGSTSPAWIAKHNPTFRLSEAEIVDNENSSAVNKMRRTEDVEEVVEKPSEEVQLLREISAKLSNTHIVK